MESSMSKSIGEGASLQMRDDARQSENMVALRRPARSRVSTILLADGLAAKRGFVSDVLKGESFHLLEASSTADVLARLGQVAVDLVILPSTGSLEGLDCCRRIKADRRTELVPVLMVTEDRIQSQIA